MGTAIILVAAAAAIGVGLVVYGTVRAQQPAGSEEQVRASYRTLADVREQLRRRFESTGTPSWIASEQRTSRLQRDLVSADIELRPYEFRLIQLAIAVLFGIIGLLRFGIGAEFLVLAAQSRATALIITWLPIAAALLLYFVVQDYFRPMLVNPLGWVMLAFAGLLLFVGNLIIRRLTAIT